MSIAERPRGFVRPTRERHYNSLPKTSLEGALGTTINIVAVLVGGSHQHPGWREAPRGDAPDSHAGHRARHAPRRRPELPGIRYNVHTYRADIDTCRCTVRITRARRVKRVRPSQNVVSQNLDGHQGSQVQDHPT